MSSKKKIFTSIVFFSALFVCAGFFLLLSKRKVIDASHSQSGESAILRKKNEISPATLLAHKPQPSASNYGAKASMSDPRPGDFEEIPGKTYKVDNLAMEYRKFASSAGNGDLVAARTLYKSLQVCESAPKDEAALSDLSAKTKDPNSIFSQLPGGTDRYLSYQRSLLNHCGVLSNEQRDFLTKWTSQLAEAGDSDARIKFARIAQPKDFEKIDFQEKRSAFIERAKRYLDDEIDSGDATALSAMAQAYMRPIINGNTTPFEVDPAMAYQYYYAYGMTSEAAPYAQSITNILARLESQLSAEQINEARDKGLEIYNSCCS
jgi:hypothetical protein